MLIPIKTRYTNKTLLPPPNWDNSDGECLPLPVCYDEADHSFSSWYHVPWRKRLAVLFGRPLRLTVLAAFHPPVAIDVDTHSPRSYVKGRV